MMNVCSIQQITQVVIRMECDNRSIDTNDSYYFIH